MLASDELGGKTGHQFLLGGSAQTKRDPKFAGQLFQTKGIIQLRPENRLLSKIGRSSEGDHSLMENHTELHIAHFTQVVKFMKRRHHGRGGAFGGLPARKKSIAKIFGEAP